MYYTHPYYHFIHHPRRKANVLKVFGEGAISATPDKAIITLGVITEGQNVSTAQKDNTIKTTNIIQALQKLGISETNIKTSDFRIEPQYDFQDGKQLFRGYRVSHFLQINNDNIEQTGTIIDMAIANGANSVSSIQFTLTQPEAVYNKALNMAIQDGQQKAQTIANSLGSNLNQTPIYIQEIPSQTPTPYQPSFLAKSGETMIQPGQLDIRAIIQIHFQYFNNK